MAYIEFFVTNGAGVSNTNGGGPRLDTNDGPTDTQTCTVAVGPGLDIIQVDVGNWGDVEINDWVCWDPAGNHEYRYVIAKPAANQIQTNAACTAAVSVTCNVCGAWATLDTVGAVGAVINVETVQSYFSNGTPPRLNIKGNHTIEAAITLTVPWTYTKPLVIQGYETTPGDRPSTRPILTVASNIQGVDLAAYNYTIWADLHFKRTYNGAAFLFDANGKIFGMLRCKLEATAGTGTIMWYATAASKLVEVHFVNSGTATGKLVYSIGAAVGCLFENGEVGEVVSPNFLCRWKNAWITSAYVSAGFVNATIEPPADKDGIAFVATAGVALLVNSIIQDVSGAGKAAMSSAAANTSTVIEYHNNFWNNTATFGINISNPIDGEGDIITDPDLDADGRPQAGSGALGAGTPAYIDIGWGQKQERYLSSHPGMQGGFNG